MSEESSRDKPGEPDAQGGESHEAAEGLPAPPPPWVRWGSPGESVLPSGDATRIGSDAGEQGMADGARGAMTADLPAPVGEASAPASDIPRVDGAPAPPKEEALLITEEMLADNYKDDLRTDFEAAMSYAPWVTLALIVVNVLIYVWEAASGALTSREAIIAAGALDRDAVLHGQIWRMVSAMFLHGGIDHLLGNMLILYVLGMAGEHAFGGRRFLFVYGVSGLSGSLVSLLFSTGPSVGASGAIFGLLGCLIAFFRRHRKIFYVRDRRVSGILVLWALYQIGMGLLSPVIDNSAHIGGFLGGLIVTQFVPARLHLNGHRPLVEARRG